jgi:hypothetical protein
LSEAVRAAPGVAEVLARQAVTREQIFLKGIDREVTVFRMGVATPAEAGQEQAVAVAQA